MQGRENLSSTLQTLLLLCNQALGARWGVRVRVRGNTNGDYAKVASAFKQRFYKAQKMSPEYLKLSLLSTCDPEVFMIIKKDGFNVKTRLEDDIPENTASNTLGSEEVF